MILVIDVGNSHIKMGLALDQQIIERFQIHTNINRTGDEYAILIKSMLANHHHLSFSNLTQIIISSVVPLVTSNLTDFVRMYTQIKPIIVGAGIKTGLRISIDSPPELGADLVVNAVAGYQRYQSATIVVGFGTALTYVAISGKGEITGVVISSGISTTLSALVKNTAQLKQVTLELPKNAIGKNTAEALRSGIVLGAIGSIEYILREMIREMGEPVKVIATGYHGFYFKEFTDILEEYDEDLTLKGLLYLVELNQESKPNG